MATNMSTHDALVATLQSLLVHNSVTFKFIYSKAGEDHEAGTVRTAVGTISHEGYVPSKNPDIQIFWDLEKQAWRSFNINNLTDILSVGDL
jgi:hypothetical protein